jgi:hypothetical protein
MPLDVRAELERRHGRDGMARVVGNAQYAYHALLESEQPLLVQRVRELGDEWGEDPGVITLFGTLIFDALREGPGPRRSMRSSFGATPGNGKARPRRRRRPPSAGRKRRPRATRPGRSS